MSGSTEVVGDVWRTLDPDGGRQLTDARLQAHHAAQFVAAMGISYLDRQPDDSHTNMEWLRDVDALASRSVACGATSVRLAMRPHPFALLVIESSVVTATFSLDGSTVEVTERWVRAQLDARGIDSGRYTLDKHYTIPSHPVGDGSPFRTGDLAAFSMLSDWFADAAVILERIARDTPSTSEVRCWPHHFDIATLIELTPATTHAPAETVGIGMDPGDTDYQEPYFYVNRSPAVVAAARGALAGDGLWHTDDWVGAVLPASRVSAVAADQQSQIQQFASSALRASTGP